MATIAIAMVVVLIAWRRRRDAAPELSAGASLSVFGMFASYTLPWYLMWGLPTLAMSGDLALTAIVASRGSLMAASYQLATGSSVQVLLISGVAPVLLLVAFLWRSTRASPGGCEPTGSVNR
ncbi:MAG: hypothetical protein M5U31_15095 [Acidimicrobiia bacterium]|nr:hypothetical protein [Acidimicrobiia bacterium]